MTDTKTVSVDRMLELTEAMLSACKAADWKLLETLEPQRNAVMHQFFESTELNADNALAIKVAIEAVLAIDKNIMSICTAEADDCQRQLAGFSQGRKAVSAYTANS